MSHPADPAAEAPTDFIREKVAQDRAQGTSITTRFPPEPNGYLHIGHAKSICLNFGIAREFHGTCNLRMDDTNPVKEDTEYVDSILEDVRWLTRGWADHCMGMKPDGGPYFASDYFSRLHDFAVQLIEKGKAYVCDLTAAEIDTFRGAPDASGKESPFRNRSVQENLDLFSRMRAGEFSDGSRTLRARIDMSSPNVWLRDPVLYRIRHTAHHQQGDTWCIYPLYDFAHCLSDYIEGVTHSLCTLEFEVHRPLYDWILQALELPPPLPRQTEFARLNLSYTVMSKRKLLQLVNERLVTGWDDPRMPTISGLRRRGVTASVLRTFAAGVGVTKYNGITDVAVLEHAIRDEFNHTAARRFAVLRPLRIVITNLNEPRTVLAANHPSDPDAGSRELLFTRELFIEEEDFMETPPPKFFRLRPGGEVRLKYGCIIRCDEVIRDADGRIAALHCTADLESWSGSPNSNRKVKGTIHWVSATESVAAEVRLVDRLFTTAEPDAEGDFKQHLNPDSLLALEARVEPSLAQIAADERFQFERLGYFCLDPDSRPEHLVFNRTVPLKDTWART